MKTLFLIFLGLCFSISASAQPWFGDAHLLQGNGTNNGSDVNVITEQSEPFIFTPENNSIDIDAGIYLPNNQIGLVLPTNFEVMQDTININQPFDLAVTLDNANNLMVTYPNVTFYLSNDTTLSSNDAILSNYNGYFFLTNGINTKNFYVSSILSSI